MQRPKDDFEIYDIKQKGRKAIIELSTNMPVTRQSGNIGKCFCRVGAYRKCGSKCKRCKFSCDGVRLLGAMKCSSGHPKKQKKSCCQKRLSIAD